MILPQILRKVNNEPYRIQRKRTKGWRMPPNTVYVGRPTPWGNPFSVKDSGGRERSIELYESWIAEEILIAPENLEEIRSVLGGKNLACWCKLDQPCHADILLELANKCDKGGEDE